MLNFESVLEISRHLFVQWEKAKRCEHCRANQQTMMVLLMAAERIFALYEAACLTYGITQSDPGMSSHRDSPQNSSQISFHNRRASGMGSFPQQVVCLKSTMRFGEMELDENTAKLLVRTLLSRRLLKLCALLGDLKELIEKLRHKDWAQQTDALKACERSTVFMVNKVLVLIGEIR